MPSTRSSHLLRLKRVAVLTLALCLLSTSTPAAPRTIVALANDTSVSFAFWFHSSGLSKFLQSGPPPPPAQERQSERNARVTRLQIFPGNLTIGLSDRVRFAAVAYDQAGNPVGGVVVRWTGQSPIPGRRVRISQQGEFEATAAGTFTIVAEALGKTAQVAVAVPPGVTRDLSRPPISIRQASTRDLPPSGIASNKESKTSAPSAPLLTKGQVQRPARMALAKRAHASKVSLTPMPLPPDSGWDDTNYWSADDPGNRVGDPPGQPLDDGAGSSNFQFVAPIYSAPGRGINLSLGAAYNSRLWNKAGNQITYDIDRGWPAPGWSLGFGKILYMGANSGSMLVDADGTRHSYTGNITNYGYGVLFNGHTTDGTFIDYSTWTLSNGTTTWGEINLPNGTQLHCYASGPGGVYPTDITDPNGNYITITYVNNTGPRIQTITDTLGRVITFHYDANNLLTAITVPGLNGGTREAVRFHYRQLLLNYAFNGLTPQVRDPNPWLIDAVYYPATATGYWLGDSDSYSSYGMLAKVVEQRGMAFSAGSLNEQGTVSPAEITRREIYNYPLSPDSSLTDAPTYTEMTESWSRDVTNFDSATTTYEVHQETSPRTTTITLPNGTRSKQYSYNAPGSFLDGLIYRDVTFATDENSPLHSSTSSWEQGAYDSPRPVRVEKTDERGQTTAAEFSYGGVYNQVTEVRDYDYGGALLRATRTQYQNSANYTTSRHIFNLPLTVEIFDGSNARVSRTEYQYDGQPLTNRPDAVQFSRLFDPYAEQNGYCTTQPDWNDPDCTGNCENLNCDGVCPETTSCPYNPITDYRGNVTQVTSYADAVNLVGLVTETRRYDTTGNLVKASTSCCEETTFNYTSDTQYAYPQSQTRGSASDGFKQVTTSAAYDFNTGLSFSATDANGRISQTIYDPTTLRPATALSPTGAHTDYAYDDVAMMVSSTTYLVWGTNGPIADQNINSLNGRGQVRQEKARGPDNGQQTWDSVDTIFNNLGQVLQQSRPYRVGAGSPVFSSATYDALGRTKTVTAPDGSVTETFYNEPDRPDVAGRAPGETTRVRDAWGRERWGRSDASGRLVEVVEPNPSGNGSVATGGWVTTYSYNTLGNLVQINQGAQTRSFKYDSIGRLTAQKLAEQSATLNDAGTYVGAGAWSDVFTYDERSNLTSRTDARGVKTIHTFGNDPLNRLQSVSWDTSGFGDTANPILPAATITYSYRQKNNPSDSIDVTQLATVTTAGVSTESYGFDTEGRVSSKTLTLTSRPNYPFVTDYIYDALDRVTDVRYPAQYGNGSAPRKVVHHDYDLASRLSGLTYDGQTFASSIAYNAASQTTSLLVGTGANQITESYSYNAQTGLLDNQTVVRNAGGSPNVLLDLSYDYANESGKRTGQLTKILNNLNHNKDRGYSYDALGRLVQATGGPDGSGLWTQTYAYDRYGNRTSVSASGYSAKMYDKLKPVEPVAASDSASLSHWERGRGEGLASNTPTPSISSSLPRRSLGNPDASFDKRSHHASRGAGGEARAPSSAPSVPQSDPPTFTNDPLQPGVTEVKAIHITELRNAINEVRAQRGLAAYGWQYSATTNDFISANPIIEMRVALDEALGPPSPAYAGGLAQQQPVLAIHIQELRNRVRDNWNSSPPPSSIPRDGHANLSYDETTNRITTAGFAYDAAGNQVRAIGPNGSASQRFRYDAANRLVQVLADDNATVIAGYTYGDSNERLIAEENGVRTYYACNASTEYVESSGSTTPQWSKSYVYLGNRLLSTVTPNGSGGEAIQFYHPDRLGTRLVTNPSTGSFFEQQTLPFGTALNESPPSGGSTGATNRRFTSYDRSPTTGLDYANNRHYDSQQGRFTQVDPIGMNSVDFSSPQTLNLYAYCANDPINHIDPSGLGFFSFLAKVFNVISKIIKIVTVIVAAIIIIAAVSLIGTPGTGALVAKALIEAGILLTNAFAPPKIAAAAGILVGIFTMRPAIIVNFAETTGHPKLARLLGILVGISSVNDFLQQHKGSPTGRRGSPGGATTKTITDDAFKDAVKVLKTDPICAAFFGVTDQRSLNRVLGTLKSIQRRVTIDENFTIGTAGTEGVGRFAHIIIGRLFFEEGAIRTNLTESPTDPRQFRAHTILHEFAHALKLIPDDSRSFDQSLLNNRTIMEKCGKGLSRL